MGSCRLLAGHARDERGDQWKGRRVLAAAVQGRPAMKGMSGSGMQGVE
jgi:hypothetical protein